MRILLIEDDPFLVDKLLPALKRSGYVVEVARDGQDGLFWAQEEVFNLIILDLGLPKISGLDLLRQLRAEGSTIPVLILTARDAWQEKVDGLKAGADDYLTKPFHYEELEARLEALMRRQVGRADQRLKVSGVELDLGRQEAIKPDGERVVLTGKEFRLLRYFMEHPDRFISKTELSEQVYEEEQLRDSNVIEVYVNRLRQMFGKSAIATRRGQGYCWVDTEVSE